MQDFVSHASAVEATPSSINPTWVIRILRDRWKLIAGSSLVTLLFAIAYLLAATPQYVASTWLVLDDQKPRVLNSQEILQSLRFDLGVPMLQQVVEGQIAMIRSQNIAEKTLRALDPTLADSDKIDEKTIERFLDKLTVKRLGSTFIIEVSYTDPDPGHAARIANTLADQYIETQVAERALAKLSATQWLEQRVEEFKERVRQEGNRIEKFKNENNLVSIGNELMSERELSRTLDRLVESRSEAANAMARLKNAEELVKNPQRLDAFSSALQSPIITELRRQQSALTSQIALTVARMGEEHPNVRNLRAQLADVDKSISRELRRMVDNLRNEATVARVRAELQAKELEQLQTKMVDGSKEIVQLKELELDNRTTRELFIALSTRLKESHIQASLETPDIRVSKRARVPQKAAWPRKAVVLLAGLFSGFALSLALILLQEFIVAPIRSAGDAIVNTAAPVVAILPSAGERPAPPSLPARIKELVIPTYRAPSEVIRIGRYALSDLSGAYAQGLFNIVSHIATPSSRNRDQHDCHVIAVVSPDTGDGKTTTALNLADYMAAAGKKVLLVDADCRSPALTAAISPLPETSIADLDPEDPAPDHLVRRIEDGGFDFCPGPHGKMCARPTIVVASPALARIIAEARNNYDCVVIDTPALREYVDATAIISQADLALVVARYEKSTRASIRAVVDQVVGNHACPVAIVLNETPRPVV